MHDLLERQCYRLAYWRVAADDINYRRFFDVNDLAALRMENDAVFEATHRLVLALIQEGKLDGLRIDHPDGLYDPAQYFPKLQEKVTRGDRPADLSAGREDSRELRAHAAQLAGPRYNGLQLRERRERPVRGLACEEPARPRVSRVHRRLCGVVGHGVRLRRYSMLRTYAGRRAERARRTSWRASRTTDRHTRDFTLTNLRQVLTEVIAAFPVYRTYVTDTASDEDRRYIEWAIARARSRSASTNTLLLDFVRSMLLADCTNIAEPVHAQVQRVCAQVPAGDGARHGQGCRGHGAAIGSPGWPRSTKSAASRITSAPPCASSTPMRRTASASWPHEMLGTSTHDTKRDEDVRARINVLSEMPGALAQVDPALEPHQSRAPQDRRRPPRARPARRIPALSDAASGTWPLTSRAAIPRRET